MARKKDPEPRHTHDYRCYTNKITCGQTVAHTTAMRALTA